MKTFWGSVSVIGCLVLAALAPGSASGTGPGAGPVPEAGEACIECHGDNGVSKDEDGKFPTLAGASVFFLENQLMIYREEARPCEQEVFEEAEEEIFGEAGKELPAGDHCKLANDLSDEEITELAEYFAAQTFEPADQPVDEGLAKKGAAIHERRCDKCHTEGGSLDLDDAGILAGQWKPYMLEQLKHYKAGKRWQPEKMEPTIEDLDEDAMKALVEYYAGQGEQRF